MSAGHSVAPWSVDNDSNVYSFSGLTVAMLDPFGEAAGALEANARLIAAAPELLEALQSAMDILGRAESNASGNPEWGYVGPRVAACRAAIAKATGGAS